MILQNAYRTIAILFSSDINRTNNFIQATTWWLTKFVLINPGVKSKITSALIIICSRVTTKISSVGTCINPHTITIRRVYPDQGKPYERTTISRHLNRAGIIRNGCVSTTIITITSGIRRHNRQQPGHHHGDEQQRQRPVQKSPSHIKDSFHLTEILRENT